MLAATKDVKSGLVMNCDCHGQVTLIELVKQINLSREIRSIFYWDNMLNKNIDPIYVDPRPGDIKHSFADILNIKEQISYTPSISFEDGLSKTFSSHSQ